MPVSTFLLGFLLAGGWARQKLGAEGNADIIFRLFFDRSATKGDGVRQV